MGIQDLHQGLREQNGVTDQYKLLNNWQPTMTDAGGAISYHKLSASMQQDQE